MGDENKIPSCGLYITTQPLKGHEDHVPAGRLVLFHGHSKQGLPIVMLPRACENNRWAFYERGYLVRDPQFPSTLKPRRSEGFYVLGQSLHVNDGIVIPRKTLVQLSYSMQGTPILYMGRFEGNTITFPEAGYKFSDDVLDILVDAGFRAPPPVVAERRLH